MMAGNAADPVDPIPGMGQPHDYRPIFFNITVLAKRKSKFGSMHRVGARRAPENTGARADDRVRFPENEAIPRLCLK